MGRRAAMTPYWTQGAMPRDYRRPFRHAWADSRLLRRIVKRPSAATSTAGK